MGRLLLTLTLFSFIACGSGRPPVAPGEIPLPTPVTAEEEHYGQQVLLELSQKYPISRNDTDILRCRGIVERLAKAAKADREPWHVYVLEGDDVENAAATRGHHVFVWTGMLKRTQTDGELATVLAHELGHVLAGHTQATPEEEAAEIMAEVSGQVVSAVLQATEFGIFADLAGMLVASAIQAMVASPVSRGNESEADHIGLFLMADAKYDPNEAIAFWTRMATQSSVGVSLSFLSSHPASEDRLKDLQAMMPEAILRYDLARGVALPKRSSGPSTTSPPSSSAPIPPAGSAAATTSPATPPPLPRRGLFRVTGESLLLRVEPSPNAATVGTLTKGDTVSAEISPGPWTRVLSPIAGYGESTALAEITLEKPNKKNKKK
jgi:Zn-dependent protease with chaperone function